MNILGGVLESQGHREEALNVAFRALEMLRDVFGSDCRHPRIVTVEDNIRYLQDEEDTSGAVSRWSFGTASGNAENEESRNRCCTIQ